MSARSAFLVVVGALALCAGTASSQQTLGSFVTDGGYDWIIGRWVAADDEDKPEITYKWILDKHAVLTEVKMGEFKFRGIVMLSPETGEVTEVAADNMGGTWKGDWTDESGNLVYRVQQTNANGEVNKAEVVHSKVDADTITVAVYGVEGGVRSSEAMTKLNYKRQPPAAAVPAAATTQSGRSTEYQKLGDLVAQGGYDWMLGKWLASDNDGQYGLEHTWALDKHAALVDMKMGDFTYHGMIMCVPSRQEIIQVGADNAGGVWTGVWEQTGEGATHKIQYTGADGMTRKMEHAYSKTDNDTFQVKEFGSQSSEARRTLTFKRQKAAPAAATK